LAEVRRGRDVPVEVDAVGAAMTAAVASPRFVELVEAHVDVEHGLVTEHEAAVTALLAAADGRPSPRADGAVPPRARVVVAGDRRRGLLLRRHAVHVSRAAVIRTAHSTLTRSSSVHCHFSQSINQSVYF